MLGWQCGSHSLAQSLAQAPSWGRIYHTQACRSCTQSPCSATCRSCQSCYCWCHPARDQPNSGWSSICRKTCGAKSFHRCDNFLVNCTQNPEILPRLIFFLIFPMAVILLKFPRQQVCHGFKAIQATLHPLFQVMIRHLFSVIFKAFQAL